MLKLDAAIKKVIEMIDLLSITEYIDEVVKIHHRITVIHPFVDGNGRIARCMLNWLFRLKGLPPVYLKYDRKEKYYEALELADLRNDYSELNNVFYSEILNSMIQLNSRFLL